MIESQKVKTIYFNRPLKTKTLTENVSLPSTTVLNGGWGANFLVFNISSTEAFSIVNQNTLGLNRNLYTLNSVIILLKAQP